MVQSQVECLCSSSTLISAGGSSLISDDSEFLLFLFLEQCGSRRLSSSTMKPNFVQIRMLSLSSVPQREGSAAYSI